jgi:hypothetical protein
MPLLELGDQELRGRSPGRSCRGSKNLTVALSKQIATRKEHSRSQDAQSVKLMSQLLELHTAILRLQNKA